MSSNINFYFNPLVTFFKEDILPFLQSNLIFFDILWVLRDSASAIILINRTVAGKTICSWGPGGWECGGWPASPPSPSLPLPLHIRRLEHSPGPGDRLYLREVEFIVEILGILVVKLKSRLCAEDLIYRNLQMIGFPNSWLDITKHRGTDMLQE
jgi:hypothetical protein